MHLSNGESFEVLEAGVDEFDKITIIKNIKEMEDKMSKILNKISNNDENMDDNSKIEKKLINNENESNIEIEKRRQCVNVENILSANDDDSSQGLHYQTYCNTCKIQFQREHNFTAHKKFYCKESNTQNNV